MSCLQIKDDEDPYILERRRRMNLIELPNGVRLQQRPNNRHRFPVQHNHHPRPPSALLYRRSQSLVATNHRFDPDNNLIYDRHQVLSGSFPPPPLPPLPSQTRSRPPPCTTPEDVYMSEPDRSRVSSFNDPIIEGEYECHTFDSVRPMEKDLTERDDVYCSISASMEAGSVSVVTEKPIYLSQNTQTDQESEVTKSQSVEEVKERRYPQSNLLCRFHPII